MEQQTQTANGKTVIRRSEEEILKHLNEQEGSGFSVKEYCEMYDIVEPTFYSWIKKYRNKSDEEEVKGFTTIQIIPSTFQETKPALFAEIGDKIKLYKEVSAQYLKTFLS